MCSVVESECLLSVLSCAKSCTNTSQSDATGQAIQAMLGRLRATWPPAVLCDS